MVKLIYLDGEYYQLVRDIKVGTGYGQYGRIKSLERYATL